MIAILFEYNLLFFLGLPSFEKGLVFKILKIRHLIFLLTLEIILVILRNNLSRY